MTEIQLEKETLLDIYKDLGYDNQPKNPTWQAAIGDKVHYRDAFIIPLAADVGLSVEYLRALPPAQLKSIADGIRLQENEKITARENLLPDPKFADAETSGQDQPGTEQNNRQSQLHAEVGGNGKVRN
jgi:hypothetical protein